MNRGPTSTPAVPSIWTTSESERVLGNKQSNCSSETSSGDHQPPVVIMPRKRTPPITNLHETLAKVVASPAAAPLPTLQLSAASSTTTSLSRKSSPPSPISAPVTAINLHHHNNLLLGSAANSKKSINASHQLLANISQSYSHGNLQSYNGYSSPTKELCASAISYAGLGLGGSSSTIIGGDRGGSSVHGGRDTPFSFVGSCLTSANRLNCLGGATGGGGGAGFNSSTGAGVDHSSSSAAAYWKHHPQQQQFYNSQYSGGGGGGNNSSGGNQKVNI